MNRATPLLIIALVILRINNCSADFSDFDFINDTTIDKLIASNPKRERVDLRGRGFYGTSQITDVGVKKLSKLKHLKHLELYGMPLTNQSLEEIGKMGKLETLVLQGCGIDDKGLKHLSGLKELKILDIDVSGSGFKSLAGLKKLEEIRLSYDFIASDKNIETLSQFSNLRKLHFLSKSQAITDLSMQKLGRLSLLEHLHIENCSKLSEASLMALGKLSHLKVLILEEVSELTPSCIKAISGLNNLESLFLDYSRLKGPSFEPLGKLTKLKRLILWGSVSNHEDLAFLQKLQSLEYFRSNIEFTEPRIKSLVMAKNLTEIVIQCSTKLSSEAQADLASLTNLRDVYLHGKAFGIDSVRALKRLPKLEALGFHQVPLSNVVKELGELNQLKSLSLGYANHHQLSESQIEQLKTVINAEIRHN